jgi:EAL domain-containing protein (putative c-di-GMP-specific phosphodiesterase class I)/GGDEF domain-containing protein
MIADSLLNALPDLAVFVRRDGVVLAHAGGASIAALQPLRDCTDERVESVWPPEVAARLRQCARKSISLRAPVEISFEHAGQAYELHARPQGPDRALCVIRRARTEPPSFEVDSGEPPARTRLDRRGFQRRFRESTARAALAETALAVAIVRVDGVAEIARHIDARVAEQVMSTAVQRLPDVTDLAAAEPAWYVGQLGEGLLAVVLETADRDVIEARLAGLCASIRAPVAIGDAQFHLTPHVGVAVLGQDASAPRALVDNARAAAVEAERDGSQRIHFFSDSLKLRSLARLDSAKELREAIANRNFRLHYVGRHDLESGREVAAVGYLRWPHPVRGEVRPTVFVSIAEATGLALALSRAALARLGEDFAARRVGATPDTRVSFGPLRHHVLHSRFVDDMLGFLAAGAVPAERLELRIAERTFVALDPASFDPLIARGVHVVVDEVARRLASFSRLARARIHGLQLDRAWVTALRSDPVALKVCRAGIAVARALGITPIATGIDDRAQRDALVALGCRYGSGDFYAVKASSDAGARRNATTG